MLYTIVEVYGIKFMGKPNGKKTYGFPYLSLVLRSVKEGSGKKKVVCLTSHHLRRVNEPV